MEELKASLNKIQVQLRATIQSHQAAIAKLKKDPKNAEVQSELRQVQGEMARLNSQQKDIVAKLRNIATQPATRTEPEAVRYKSIAPVKTVVTTGITPVTASPRTAQRPSILQGTSRRSGYVLRVQNDVPVVNVKTPTDSKDIRGLLSSSVTANNLSPAELQKVQYMACLNLVTRERLKELQSKRRERKRRSTATPQFSYVHGHLQPERKRSNIHEDGAIVEKRRGRPASVTPVMETQPQQQPMLVVEETCAVCRRAGQLFSCDSCQRLYHYTCLSMPSRPPAKWSCPKCQATEGKSVSVNNSQPGLVTVTTPQSVGNSSLSPQKVELQRKYRELLEERSQLEVKRKQLSQDVLVKRREKSKLLKDKDKAEEELNKLKEIIKSLQS